MKKPAYLLIANCLMCPQSQTYPPTSLCSPTARNSLPDSEVLREDDNESHYADDDAFSSDSLSGHDHQRRKVPNSSTVVPFAVREKLFPLYDEKCWLCGVKAKHVAHVIAKSERLLVVHPRVPDVFSSRKANTWCSFANTLDKACCTCPLSTPSRAVFLSVPSATTPSMNGVRYGPSFRRSGRSSPAKKSFKLGDYCSRLQRLVSATPAPTDMSLEPLNWYTAAIKYAQAIYFPTRFQHGRNCGWGIR